MEERELLRQLLAEQRDTRERLARLEERLANPGDTTEAAGGAAWGDPAPADPGPVAPTHRDDPFWVVSGIEERVPAPGAVYYAGSVTVAGGPVQWQVGRPTEYLLESDWAEHAPALAALASPVRLTILQAFLGGASSAAELSGAGGLGTTGQIYHHLNQLVAQGWLRVAGRGHYAIPPERIVPLLAVLAAVGSPA